MHVYTLLAHLHIRIDQNTPFFNKRLKKISRLQPQLEEGHPLPTPGASIIAPSALDLRGPPNEMSGSAAE